MSRELSPCGTAAAYERHRRRGEPIDDACKAAARERAQSRRQAEIDRQVEAKQRLTADLDSERDSDRPMDRLERARYRLRHIEASMEVAPPSAMAGLARQHATAVEDVARLEGSGREPSLIDQLAAAREARLSRGKSA